MELVLHVGMSAIQVRPLACVSRAFRTAVLGHPDDTVPMRMWGLQPLVPHLLRGGRIRRIRPLYRRLCGLLTAWDRDGQEEVFMCVECGEWDLLEGEPWDPAVADREGHALVPRDALEAREWLTHDRVLSQGARLQPPAHWSIADVRAHYEYVVSVWPGDICRACYRAWDGVCTE